uniref:Uncharacterized protein LOC100180888 n=1 Tax=Phallusia mammillata TaxID=59560 RepID=A0A6F9DI06_9ASCI|nr:uncharacterized protein LOC100180888 [Phallusia mammillata]
MANPHGYHTRPSGDESTTGSITGGALPTVVQRPEGDASTTTSLTSSQPMVSNIQHAEGSGEGPMLRAEAFYHQRNFVHPPGGVQVEQPSLAPDREVDGVHLNMIASKCDKRLFRELLNRTQLSEIEKKECLDITERKQACAKLLGYWKINDGHPKTFEELINLLRQVELPSVRNIIDELNEIRV